MIDRIRFYRVVVRWTRPHHGNPFGEADMPPDGLQQSEKVYTVAEYNIILALAKACKEFDLDPNEVTHIGEQM